MARRQFKPVRLRLERHPHEDRVYTFGPDLDGHPRFYVIPNPIPGRGYPWFLLDRGNAAAGDHEYTVGDHVFKGAGRAFPSLGAIREAYSTAEAQQDAGIIDTRATRAPHGERVAPGSLLPQRFADKREAERVAARLNGSTEFLFCTIGDGLDGSAGWLVVAATVAR